MTDRRRLGRNDLCWCGSGKKFKRCHLNRDRQEGENPYVAAKKVDAFNRKRVCLHAGAPADCSKDVISAHTIQRGKSLKRIAEDGHVLGFSIDMGEPVDGSDGVVIKPIGINRASTFCGFCSKHDNSTFAPVEDVAFTGTDEQCFLLGYRSLCRELYQKQTSAAAMDYIRTLDRGRPIVEQVFLQDRLHKFQQGTNAGLRDLEYRKGKFDETLRTKAFSEVSNYVVFTNEVPDVLASFGATVEHDFHGNMLQDLTNLGKLMDSVYVSIIAMDRGGAIVLSWRDLHSAACTRFVQSLAALEDHELPSAIVRFVFEYSENTFFRPTWWRELSPSLQRNLVSRITSGADLNVARRRDCLCSDGNQFVSWSVIGRQSNRQI